MASLAKKSLLGLTGVLGSFALATALLNYPQQNDKEEALERIGKDVAALAPLNPNLNPAIKAVFNDYKACLQKDVFPIYEETARYKRLADTLSFSPVLAGKFVESQHLHEMLGDAARDVCQTQAQADLRQTLPVYTPLQEPKVRLAVQT